MVRRYRLIFAHTFSIGLRQKTAGIDDAEMNRTFNNGIGMVVIAAAEAAEAVAATLRQHGETVYAIGHITERTGAAVTVA